MERNRSVSLRNGRLLMSEQTIQTKVYRDFFTTICSIGALKKQM